ncbi:uncharacterized protein [Miscanthus floridulus]|uniref:uncharacterized protein n=1 Tax=Miscanthus floridulus TaxID=154761 RepID=UPI003457FF35
MEIDERTRFKADYVRVKIACRDVTKVPKTADAMLGIYEFEFSFEREVPETQTGRMLTSGIKVGEKEPPVKKYKHDETNKQPNTAGSVNQSEQSQDGADPSKLGHTKCGNQGVNSAPPKMHNTGADGGEKNKMDQDKTVDSSKQPASKKPPQPTENASQEERIPNLETSEEYDYDSDTLSEKLRKIDAYGLVNDEKHISDGDKQFWHMDVDKETEQGHQAINAMIKNQNTDNNVLKESEKGGNASAAISVEQQNMDVDIIINSQESVRTNQTGEPVEEIQDKVIMEDTTHEEMMEQVIQAERRRNARLKKDIMLTTMDKNEAMAKKRSLEGLYNELDKEQMEGAKTMLRIAQEVMTAQTSRQVDRLLLHEGDSTDSDGDRA